MRVNNLNDHKRLTMWINSQAMVCYFEVLLLAAVICKFQKMSCKINDVLV